MRRLAAAAGVAGVVLLGAAAVRFVIPDGRLRPRILLEDVVTELAADRADVPVREERLEPGDPLRGDGPRRSIVAPSRFRFRVDVPPDAGLRFSVGVEGSKRRESSRSGLRFTVDVDGHSVWSRTINPAASRHDRRWFDERIELGEFAGRSVEVAFAADAESADAPPAGTPGWTHLRLVRESERDRQLATPAAPSVLVLLVDTLRADRVGCYGAAPSPTPTLDRLAAEGLLFEESIAQSSWTLPSVASLLTGLHPRSHGALGDIRHAHHDGDLAAEFLRDGVVTLAEAASHAGITTAGVSANPLVSRATNLAQGFETFVDLPWDPAGKNWTPAAEVNRAFLEWLRPNRRHRFLAYLHYMEPHDPYTPPDAFRPAAPPGIAPALASGWVRDVANAVNWGGSPPPRPDELDHLRRLYTGEARAWDDALAALLRGLEDVGVRASTIIVVTADHGEEFHEHGHLTHGGHLYEESVRVPLVIAGPGIPAARRRDVAQGVDLFPTLAARLGITIPAGLPGRDLLVTHESGPVVSETARGIAPGGGAVGLVALRVDGWKLINSPTLGRFELYDLVHDPSERDDRWPVAPEGARLAALLGGWQTRAAHPPPANGHDPGLDAKLRALGYVR